MSDCVGIRRVLKKLLVLTNLQNQKFLMKKNVYFCVCECLSVCLSVCVCVCVCVCLCVCLSVLSDITFLVRFLHGVFILLILQLPGSSYELPAYSMGMKNDLRILYLISVTSNHSIPLRTFKSLINSLSLDRIIIIRIQLPTTSQNWFPNKTRYRYQLTHYDVLKIPRTSQPLPPPPPQPDASIFSGHATFAW